MRRRNFLYGAAALAASASIPMAGTVASESVAADVATHIVVDGVPWHIVSVDVTTQPGETTEQGWVTVEIVDLHWMLESPDGALMHLDRAGMERLIGRPLLEAA